MSDHRPKYERIWLGWSEALKATTWCDDANVFEEENRTEYVRADLEPVTNMATDQRRLLRFLSASSRIVAGYKSGRLTAIEAMDMLWESQNAFAVDVAAETV